MKAHEKAAQIWPVLSLAARNRQVLTYDILGSLIGVPRFSVARLLEPIQSYCLINKLPALTALIVNKNGAPGVDFLASEDFLQEQQNVFEHDWIGGKTPAPEELFSATNELPISSIMKTALGYALD